MNAQQEQLLARKIAQGLRQRLGPRQRSGLKQGNPALARVVRNLSPEEIAKYAYISVGRARALQRNFVRFVQTEGRGYRNWKEAYLAFDEVRKEPSYF